MPCNCMYGYMDFHNLAKMIKGLMDTFVTEKGGIRIEETLESCLKV